MAKLKLLVPALFLFVAACAGLPFGIGSGLTAEEEAALTANDKLYALVEEADGVLTQVEKYVSQPRCLAGQSVACSDVKVVAVLRDAVAPVDEALDALEAARAAGTDPLANAATLRVALGALERRLVRNGINPEGTP